MLWVEHWVGGYISYASKEHRGFVAYASTEDHLPRGMENRGFPRLDTICVAYACK